MNRSERLSIAPEKRAEKLMKYFPEERIGYVRAGEKKWFLPGKYQQEAEKLINFKLRDDDVWIMGYPRSGTTLTQELVWLLVNDLDFEKANEMSASRVPLVEGSIILDERNVDEFYELHPDQKDHVKPIYDILLNALPVLDERKGRRVIKTHLAFELLPPDLLERNKIIYIYRYPKDVAVSYFHLQSNLVYKNYNGDFETYWDFFKNDNCLFAPYFEHVKQGYEKRDHPNVFFTSYEDLRKDLRGSIDKMAAFLGKQLSEEDADRMMQYLDFENFKSKNNESQVVDTGKGKEGSFIRQGKVGGWRKYFTEEMNRDADEWIEKKFAEIGL